MANRRVSQLYKAKNSTTTGCFLLTRSPVVVCTVFAAQLTAAIVDFYVSWLRTVCLTVVKCLWRKSLWIVTYSQNSQTFSPPKNYQFQTLSSLTLAAHMECQTLIEYDWKWNNHACTYNTAHANIVICNIYTVPSSCSASGALFAGSKCTLLPLLWGSIIQYISIDCVSTLCAVMHLIYQSMWLLCACVPHILYLLSLSSL